MTLKLRFVGGDVLDADAEFVAARRDDPIDQQEGIAMRQKTQQSSGYRSSLKSGRPICSFAFPHRSLLRALWRCFSSRKTPPARLLARSFQESTLSNSSSIAKAIGKAQIALDALAQRPCPLHRDFDAPTPDNPTGSGPIDRRRLFLRRRVARRPHSRTIFFRKRHFLPEIADRARRRAAPSRAGRHVVHQAGIGGDLRARADVQMTRKPAWPPMATKSSIVQEPEMPACATMTQ